MAKKASSLSPQDDLRLIEDRFFVSESGSSSLFQCEFIDKLASEEHWVLGLDEVGRGCLAGPVVAGAAAFRMNDEILKLIPQFRVTDSKKLPEEARQKVCDWMTQDTKFLCATAEASVAEIDEINILQASLLAMKRAYQVIRDQISPQAKVWIMCDGNKAPCLESPFVTTVVKGDSKSFVIAAASIFAKQHRDVLMRNLAKEFPEYFWEKNVGYPTGDHTSALEKIGVSSWHRKTFRWAGTQLGEYPLRSL